MKKENLLGQKFNRLLVIAEAEPQGKKKQSAWLCLCNCGIEKIIKSEELKSGGTKSCGCLKKEKNSENGIKMGNSNILYHPSETTARRVWRNRYKDGISFEDFYKKSQENCYYCGSEPNNIQNNAKDDKKASLYAKENGNFIYNGLDRIDSSKDHSINNVLPCCKWCNYAKRERSQEEFLNWVIKLYNHNNLK